MDDQSQIEIPESFMALYLRNGRATETRRTIEERYDLCEDLAIQTSEFCHVLQFKDDLAESEVLRRVLSTLRAGEAVSHDEAGWVVVRVAELLQWPRPDPAETANGSAPGST